MRTLVDLKRRGGKVSSSTRSARSGLVNFRVPSDIRSMLLGSKIADEYVQPHIGGDIALLMGVAKALLELGAVDEQFVHKHAEGGEPFRTAVAALEWDDIEQGSGVARGQIESVARSYATARSAVFGWTMGITHHEHGVGERPDDREPGDDARHARPAAAPGCCRCGAIPMCRGLVLWEPFPSSRARC